MAGDEKETKTGSAEQPAQGGAGESHGEGATSVTNPFEGRITMLEGQLAKLSEGLAKHGIKIPLE